MKRRNHTAVWTGTEMIVWGGWDGSDLFASGGRIVPVPFNCGLGKSSRQSGYTCSAGALGYACTPGPSRPEVCNGLDDDCDNAIDDGAPPAAGRPLLVEAKSGATSGVSWAAVRFAASYDVVSGSLPTLRSSLGDFTTGTSACH